MKKKVDLGYSQKFIVAVIRNENDSRSLVAESIQYGKSEGRNLSAFAMRKKVAEIEETQDNKAMPDGAQDRTDEISDWLSKECKIKRNKNLYRLVQRFCRSARSFEMLNDSKLSQRLNFKKEIFKKAVKLLEEIKGLENFLDPLKGQIKDDFLGEKKTLQDSQEKIAKSISEILSQWTPERNFLVGPVFFLKNDGTVAAPPYQRLGPMRDLLRSSAELCIFLAENGVKNPPKLIIEILKDKLKVKGLQSDEGFRSAIRSAIKNR